MNQSCSSKRDYYYVEVAEISRTKRNIYSIFHYIGTLPLESLNSPYTDIESAYRKELDAQSR